MSITIRAYQDTDEPEWVRCRVLSFLDSSYYDDVKREKEQYDHPSICLIAEHANRMIGFIDVEYEESRGEVCYLKGSLGANIWHLGVLPEYRSRGIAGMLWEQAKALLIERDIQRVELWTQDDVPANKWYEKQGFKLTWSYLNIFVYGDDKDPSKSYINHKVLGKIFGMRCLNFEAPIERKYEFMSRYERVHEVRLYELKL
ncbi:MAG: GNAT family N-acetyltransferase [Cellulosilyticaceae bacterium]